jgi:hypothetical protein
MPAKTPKSIIEKIRLFAPLIALCIVTPFTIYSIITSTDTLGKLLSLGGTLVLAAVLFWWYVTERNTRQLKKLEGLIEQVAGERLAQPLQEMKDAIKHFEQEEAFRYLSTVYGWGYASLDVTGTIDREGGMRIERNLTVQARRKLDRLPQSLHVEPSGRDAYKSANIAVFSRTEGIRIPERKVHPLNNGWVVDLSLFPPVEAGRQFSLSLSEELPKGNYQVGVQRTERPKPGEQCDWLNWRIDRPFRRLSMTIVFPRGYQPKNEKVCVYYQPLPQDPDDGQHHEDEEARAEGHLIKGNMDGQTTLTLNIELPVLGLLYHVRWDPLE